MLGDFNEGGIGVYTINGLTYYTLDLGKRLNFVPVYNSSIPINNTIPENSTLLIIKNTNPTNSIQNQTYPDNLLFKDINWVIYNSR